MSSLIEILDEMAATLDAIVGPVALGQDAVQVVGRLNLNPTPPAIDIYPADPFRGTESASFLDRGELFFTVRARASTADNEAGQDILLHLMDDDDPLSVAAALEDDQTLNGLAGSVKVDGPTGFQPFGDSGAHGGILIGCEWTVTILNAKT